MIECVHRNNEELRYDTFEDIRNYEKIVRLNCSSNNLTTIPKMICNLINLTVS